MTETPFTNKTAFYSRPLVLETFRFHNRVIIFCVHLFGKTVRVLETAPTLPKI